MSTKVNPKTSSAIKHNPVSHSEKRPFIDIFNHSKSYIMQVYKNEKNAENSAIKNNPLLALVTSLALKILGFFIGFLFSGIGTTILVGSFCIIDIPLIADSGILMRQIANKTGHLPIINWFTEGLASLFKTASNSSMPEENTVD